MNYFDRLAERLSRTDMVQGTVLLFVALGFTLAIRWPTGISLVNESWFALAPTRVTLLAFAGLGYGASLGSQPAARSRRQASSAKESQTPFGSPAWRNEIAVTLPAIWVLAAVSAPFEIGSHAASYPGTPVWWSLLVPFVAVSGYFGTGLLLGRATALVRLRGLLPLLVPALLAGAAYLDVSVGRTVVNPWSASLALSPTWLAVLGALSLVNLWWLLPRRTAPPHDIVKAGSATGVAR